MARLSRRRLIGAGGCTVAAGIASMSIGKPEARAVEVISSGPDTELIAMCDRFNELERMCWPSSGVHFDEPEEAGEARRKPLEQEQDALFERIIALRAMTLDGFRARAAMFKLWDAQLDDKGDSDGYWPDRMAWALVRDLTGEGI